MNFPSRAIQAFVSTHSLTQKWPTVEDLATATLEVSAVSLTVARRVM